MSYVAFGFFDENSNPQVGLSVECGSESTTTNEYGVADFGEMAAGNYDVTVSDGTNTQQAGIVVSDDDDGADGSWTAVYFCFYPEAGLMIDPPSTIVVNGPAPPVGSPSTGYPDGWYTIWSPTRGWTTIGPGSPIRFPADGQLPFYDGNGVAVTNPPVSPGGYNPSPAPFPTPTNVRLPGPWPAVKLPGLGGPLLPLFFLGFGIRMAPWPPPQQKPLRLAPLGGYNPGPYIGKRPAIGAVGGSMTWAWQQWEIYRGECPVYSQQ